MNYRPHYPVFKEEIVQLFCSESANKENFLCDCTFGGGGHTLALARANPMAQVMALDQDPEAIESGRIKICKEGVENRVELIRSNFTQLKALVESRGLMGRIHGALFDLGVSSHQLETASRGFSFRLDGPLDMRMGGKLAGQMTAREVLETKSEGEIADIIFRYGEEKHSRRIASKVCEFRSQNQLHSTKQLENIVFHCYPKRERYAKIHPATKTFQALRAYVNGELAALEQVLEDAWQILSEGGHIAIISFHSLEDRAVKQQFLKWAKAGLGKVVTKRPMLPTAKELEENKRSRSAKLRIFKKEQLCQEGKGLTGQKGPSYTSSTK